MWRTGGVEDVGELSPPLKRPSGVPRGRLYIWVAAVTRPPPIWQTVLPLLPADSVVVAVGSSGLWDVTMWRTGALKMLVWLSLPVGAQNGRVGRNPARWAGLRDLGPLAWFGDTSGPPGIGVSVFFVTPGGFQAPLSLTRSSRGLSNCRLEESKLEGVCVHGQD
jgi:hypothetical protein